MRREVLKRFLIFTFLLFILLIVYYSYKESKDMIKINYVTFSKESGFYSESIDVKLQKNIDLPVGSELYYTLDGNDPTKDSNQYKGIIKLELVKDEIKVYPLKVIAYYKGQYSNILEKTYIVDENINVNDINIISITSDEKNLYDYETGIMVPGITHDENVRKGALGDIRGNYSNRADDWLRDSTTTIFDKNGKVLINQETKLGISGGSSAIYFTPKSLKIDARVFKDSKKLNFVFYDNNFYSNYSLINKYNSIRLRTGSQDMNESNIRSSIISRICEQSGYGGCSTTKRGIVFLNGKFYGLVDMQQIFSNSTIKNKYFLDDSNKIEKKGYKESNVLEALNIKEYFLSDLNIKENRKELEKRVDMDDYILYIAIQIIISNSDWPQNNYEMWKYTGKYNENNKYSDGKYRTLIYDLDETYYYNHAGNIDVLKAILNNEYKAKDSVIKNVLSSKYYCDKFVMTVQDLSNTSFNVEKVLSIVDEEVEKINNAYKKYYSEDKYNNWIENIELLKKGINEHAIDLKDDFKNYYGLEKTHTVNVKATEGIQINFSNQELYQNKEYNNSYYRDIDLRFKYKEYPGYKFEYWLVNGEKIYDEELVIESAKHRDCDEINIEAISKYQKKDNHLLISEIYSKGYSDWIKITNTGKEKINIKDYYLSDRDNKLKKYQLPSIVLKPKESIIINGNKNYYSIGDYICNFNMSQSEKIVLSKDNQIVDYVIVPRTSEIETYGRYDNSNTFKFFMNENNERKTTK